MEMTENMYKAVLHFSNSYNVSSPITMNLEAWWKNAINQLENWEINLYYIALKKARKNGMLDGEISNMMLNELENSNLILRTEKRYAI